jgi:hypothetical protein
VLQHRAAEDDAEGGALAYQPGEVDGDVDADGGEFGARDGSGREFLRGEGAVVVEEGCVPGVWVEEGVVVQGADCFVYGVLCVLVTAQDSSFWV